MSGKFLNAASRVGLACAILAVVTLAGCGGIDSTSSTASVARAPVTHTVVADETVYRIAKNYGVSVGRLMAANNISDPRDLRVGQVLVIPGAYRAATAVGGGVSPYSGARERRQFQWPVARGEVASGFGVRNGAMHDGVDIDAPVGTPVYAADAGVVIFSGTLHGYGNTVIIRHDASYATVYGHNQRNLVREGQQVTRGQQIGEIGRSGRTTGANLHFEVRRDNAAQDPLAYLPQPAPAGGITFAAAGGS